MSAGSQAMRSARWNEALAEDGEAALTAGKLEEAIALFHEAEPMVRDPDRCAGGRWMAYMLAGQFEAAWKEGDAIRRRGAPDPHRFWNGEALAGRRVILRSLHGFGDAVQMLRFLPRLRDMADDVIVEVAPRLMDLAPYFDGMGSVITWGEGAPAKSPAWDVQMEVMELPYMLRVTAETLAPTCGYLRLPEPMRERVRTQAGRRERPRVGLAWGAGEWNLSRSVPFTELDPLLACEGVEFWSLQGEPARAEWLARGPRQGCRDVYECGAGLLPLAATIECMDLVITVDTVAAHLAGALGVPCWLLLQKQADWRWMQGRLDTPWYPSLRLKRQPEAGDWTGLVRQVREDLDRWYGH